MKLHTPDKELEYVSLIMFLGLQASIFEWFAEKSTLLGVSGTSSLWKLGLFLEQSWFVGLILWDLVSDKSWPTGSSLLTCSLGEETLSDGLLLLGFVSLHQVPPLRSVEFAHDAGIGHTCLLPLAVILHGSQSNHFCINHVRATSGDNSDIVFKI